MKFGGFVLQQKLSSEVSRVEIASMAVTHTLLKGISGFQSYCPYFWADEKGTQ